MKIFSVILATALLAASLPAQATPAPVRVTGDTGANEELLKDTLNLLTQFAPLYQCDRITAVETHHMPRDTIPRFASYRTKDEASIYERWTANFCGKFVKFMVIYSPDPAGGYFITITHPYPKDAL